ncbi:MAG: hypothetical protein WCK46_00655 [Candidatus Adlerbacteria bacterium]
MTLNTLADLGRFTSWEEAFETKAYRLFSEGKLDAVTVLSPEEYKRGLTAQNVSINFFRPKYIAEELGIEERLVFRYVCEVAIANHGREVKLQLEHGQGVFEDEDTAGVAGPVWLLVIICSDTKTERSQKSDFKKKLM